MEFAVSAAWLMLAAVHLVPAAVLFRPGLLPQLYGIEAGGAAGVLLVHRGGLFLAVVAVCVLAIVEPGARRAAALVAGVSIVSFLLVYARMARPPELRTIARADLAALVPLAVVLWEARL